MTMENEKNQRGSAELGQREHDVRNTALNYGPMLLGAAQILALNTQAKATDVRAEIKAWLISVMKHKNWSPERWAREADISGTTITRFLNADDPHRTPSSKTLDKLARAAGVPAMQDANRIMIAVIRRDSLFHAAKSFPPAAVDIFAMPPEETHPAIEKYADCRMVEMDNGRFAICRKAEPTPGQRVVALCRSGDEIHVGPYVYAPPLLTSLEHVSRSIRLADAGVAVLGRMVGEFIDYAD